MPYETLIAALLEEGEAKRKTVLRKAQAEADRLIAEAASAAEALERETDTTTRREAAKRRTEILGRAVLSARQMLLQAKQEIVEAVWRRATEKAFALAGVTRTQVLRKLLDELLVEAPPGPVKAILDSRERVHLEGRLKDLGIPLEAQPRGDLALGLELEGAGVRLRNSFLSRLTKAKPDLIVELNQLLFKAANS
jgi:vacuolar-type H+-ATPase subunit E/Vma4